MTVKYQCNISGKEFDKDSLNDEIIPAYIVLNSLNQRIGLMHISKEEMPNIFQEKIDKSLQLNDSGETNEVYIYVTGDVKPVNIKDNELYYTYTQKDVKVSSFMLRKLYKIKGNDLIESFKYRYDNEKMEEFYEKVSDTVIEKCQKISKDNKNSIKNNESSPGIAFR